MDDTREQPASGEPPLSPEPRVSWSDWYRFARDELGYDHGERVDYANHRFVEEQNRASLRGAGL